MTVTTDRDQLREAWAFLQSRLSELDFSQEPDVIWRDFAGHVSPAVGRMDNALAALEGDE